ncbi:MAG: PAS domain-containing protein [Rhizomicrobium sp.]
MTDAQKIHRLGTQTRSIPPALQALISYWLQKCGGRPLPGRDSLPVQELRPWLGHLALVEVADDGRFRLRLSGTDLIRRFGREATGRDVDELADDIRRQLRAILQATIRGGVPVVANSSVPLGRATHWYCEVALPLAGADGGLSTILFCSYPQREP